MSYTLSTRHGNVGRNPNTEREDILALDHIDAVEALMVEARWLLDREPMVGLDEREAVVHELFEVDLALERLGLRARAASLSDLDLDELERCARQLERLRCCWVSEH